jgi:3-methyl-2-oxobutanoate hydroxymethyltransferase
VKLEGGVTAAETVSRIVEWGISVMGHIGLTPQSVNQLGGYKVQGRTPEAAARLIRDAQALQEAGAFAIVLESVPTLLSRLITERLSIPTIGIGAGLHCDGQVQVLHDMMGLFTDFVPKHAKRYAEMAQVFQEALAAYVREVREDEFPTEKESFTMDESVLAELASL